MRFPDRQARGPVLSRDKYVNYLTFAVPAKSEPLAGLEPLRVMRKRRLALFSGGLSILLILVIMRELLNGGLGALRSAMPADPLFYLVFLAIYAVQPLSDFIIFRRLWGLPAFGIVPILRKLVANELLLGYSGEAYFYAWARARMNMVAAPFAAIKDVSILSAVVGNVVTLALLGLASPFALAILPVELVKPVLGSIAVILGLSLAILAFRRRLFSLPVTELRWVFGVHLLRTFAYTGLLALFWHLALPDVPLGLWILLVTGRQLVARLPLVPNKDIVFAGLALLLVGSNTEVTRLMAITVAMTLLCHGVVLALTWLPMRARSPA